MKLRFLSYLSAAMLMVSLAVVGSSQVYAGGMADKTKAVLDSHLTAFGSGNVDAILANYASDAVIMFPGGMVSGHADIRGMFEGLVTEFGQPGVTFEMLNSDVSGEIAFIVWKAETGKAVYEMGTDTYVIRDNKIVMQTVATKNTMK
ncbi:MAG: nuclear transport factor 2 family protein [Alphaproteobacteria bacterium]|nr:nuclear transport factor 2 family protein [Alphaproteobacteria bacterium]